MIIAAMPFNCREKNARREMNARGRRSVGRGNKKTKTKTKEEASGKLERVGAGKISRQKERCVGEGGEGGNGAEKL